MDEQIMINIYIYIFHILFLLMRCVDIKTQYATCILAQGKGALRSAPEPK